MKKVTVFNLDFQLSRLPTHLKIKYENCHLHHQCWKILCTISKIRECICFKIKLFQSKKGRRDSKETKLTLLPGCSFDHNYSDKIAFITTVSYQVSTQALVGGQGGGYLFQSNKNKNHICPFACLFIHFIHKLLITIFLKDPSSHLYVQ